MNARRRSVDQNGAKLDPQEGSSTYVDEAYIRSLQEDCSWSRDNGVIELIPIAVVQQINQL